MNNFLISGMGRSGTAFLSTMMNKSKRWTVLHEPQPSRRPKRALAAIQRRFDRNDFYGEVNSYLRYIFDDLKVEKKGIIVRDPAMVFLSIANRTKNVLDGLNVLLDSLQESFSIIDHAVGGGVYTIRFEKMISNVGYINEIIKHFGIQDVRLNKTHLGKKINPNKRIVYRRFQDLPIPAIRGFRKALGWFSQNHGYAVP